MRASPLNSYWTIGSAAAVCEVTRAEFEEAAAAIGIIEASVAINGIPYVSMAAFALIQEEIGRRRGDASHPVLGEICENAGRATRAAARAMNSANQ